MRKFGLLVVAGLSVCPPAVLAQETGDERQVIKDIKTSAKEGSPAIPRIAEALSHPSRKARLAAVEAIMDIGTQHSVDPLLRAARDNDPEIQFKAVVGLVNFYLPGYSQSGVQKLGTAIKGRFTDTNTDIVPAYVTVREDVITTLGKLARGGTSLDVRAASARGAGVLRGKSAVPDLLEALRSKDTAVMYESLIALQKIGDTSVGPRVSVYIRDLDDRVQMAAIETTGLLRTQSSLRDLEKVYADPRNDRIRRMALLAIAMMPDEKSRAVLESALEDRDEHVRAAAAEGIGRLGVAQDVTRLNQLFQAERKMPTRLAQAFALTKLGRTELGEFSPTQYLINTLNSGSYKGVAEGYLIELSREPNMREQLYSVLPAATRGEKIGIARVLSVSGDKRSLEKLEALSKDTDEEVAREGLAALRALRARVL